MEDLKNIIKKRRSRYDITNQSPISDEQIKELIDFAVLHVPSPFNSQSARIVLLLNDNHKKFWNIVKEELAKTSSKANTKIDNSFASGYGTILFYEDQSVVRSLQERFPKYSDNFLAWSEHTTAMHQYAIWLLLESEGLGASLQHYNPLIDKRVSEEWNINSNWKLIAQMPFGKPLGNPGEKEFHSLDSRSIVFK